jgi:hypothetical protein
MSGLHGPAFPRSGEFIDGYFSGQEGMTLRQWYVSQSLAGLIATGADIPAIVKMSFDLADALISHEIATLPKRDPNDDLPF